jgi:urea transport system ATP-binding protein
VIGPNGAGKTTMMDVITGRTRPDAGRAFFGQAIDLTRMSESAIAQAGIGRKFQKPTVFEQHTVWENLELALKADRRWWRSLAWRTSLDAARRIDELLATIRLEDEAHRPGGAPRARPEAAARDRHPARAGAAAAPARRAGRGHDRRGDRAPRRPA